MTRKYTGAVVSALLSATALSGGAFAQDEVGGSGAGAKSATPDGGEIVVTAQRREQRLRDVPVSVSAFTNDDIQKRGVTSLDALQAAIPGIRLVNIGPGSERIQLRGVAQYQGLPTVGMYVDEFSVSNQSASGASEVSLLDLERIEVLRGPQPALYGEGSMGGTIRYITANPDLSEFGGNILGELSAPKDGEIGWRTEGAVNLPLITDTAGFRIAAAHEEAAGWIDGPLGEDTNDRNTTTVRGKLLVEPSDAFTISALGLYHESEQFVKSYSFDGYNSSQTNPSQARQEYEMGVLQIGYDFGAATLLSVSGVLHQEGRSVDDSTKFYQTLFGGPIIEDVLSDSTGDFTKWSQELRLTSNGDTRFKYMLGASYTDFDSDGYITADAVSLIPVPPTALGLVFTQESSRKSRIWAVFGNFSYDLTDWASLEFGGRYFSEDLETDSIFTLVDLLGPGADFVDITGGKATFETFNPKMGLNFKTGDSGIVYIDAARGFRSGGFNGVTDPSVSPTYDPEKLWTYEIGAKQSTLDGRLFVELAVYYNDYKDIQLNQVVNPTVATVLNGGRASGPGVDFIIQARPKEDLVFSASLGWNHLRFDTDSIDKLKEDPADLVPDWNFSTSVDYTPQLTDKLQLVAHADVGFIDQAQITLRSIAALGFDAVTPSEARTVANLKLGLACDRLEGYVFANNLLNEIKIVNPAFGAFFEPIYTQPRTLGVGLRARF